MSISLNVGSVSAIPDFETLVETLQTVFLDRDDLDAQIPAFVLLAEADMNRELRTTEMEVTTTFSATSEDTALPFDFLAMRSIYIEGVPDRAMNAKSPAAMRREYDGSVGTPNAYAIVSNGLRLAPPPASEIALTMDYYATIENLSVTIPSNWVLEKHPQLYIHGPLYYAYMALDNPERAAQHKTLFDMLIASVNRAANNNRFGGGPLIPNTVRQVRRAVS